MRQPTASSIDDIREGYVRPDRVLASPACGLREPPLGLGGHMPDMTVLKGNERVHVGPKALARPERTDFIPREHAKPGNACSGVKAKYERTGWEGPCHASESPHQAPAYILPSKDPFHVCRVIVSPL